MPAANKPRNVTMKDVAQRANVALGTVSRIINRNATVSPELRDHVEAVIEELGYRPNVIARTMRTQRTQAIGIVVTDITQPVAARLVSAASEHARARGFAPIVGDFLNDVAAEDQLIRFMSERNVDGLILTISSDENAELIGTLEDLGIPVVLWEREASGHFVSVRTDHGLGAAMAARALLKRGRRHVALVAGHEHTWTGREQVRGMRETLEGAARLTVAHTGRFDAEGFLASLSAAEPVDAVVANVHDIPAIMGGLKRLGLRCPEDVSVVSIGDDAFLQISAPPITAIRLRPDHVGETAVRCLIEQIDRSPGASSVQPDLVAPEFIVRASV